MKSDRRVPVAIVGGGASGTILAVQLARRGTHSLLIDGSGRVGCGVAYSTTEPAHLLNVRAEGMSALADDPDHFARKFEAEGGNRTGFAQRRAFGRYLRELLNDAVERGEVEVANKTAVGASHEDGRWQVTFDDGSSISAEALVLATGNQEPAPLRAFAGTGERFIANPWDATAQDAVRRAAADGEDVLLIGTGLTMVDLVLSLDAAGHSGRIVALSRRGLIPRVHTSYEPAPIGMDRVPTGDLRGMLRWLRRRSAEVGWRAAVDSLRPHSHPLWQGLTSQQQERFLRHARPWWDVHRHRIAPEVAATVMRLISEDRLEIIAGRVAAATDCGNEIAVEISPRRSSTSRTARFGYVFNCTGPLHSIAGTKDPLLRSLLDLGFVHPDHLGIGIEVDERSRAVGAEHLWALGPLTKARYWEIIAVPDIREQAAEIAGDIARELNA
jgi:uncharacterized NAD(P)/FAD-binding protein YdhS